MSQKLYDFATQKKAIQGYFPKNLEFNLGWRPQYIDEFPKVTGDVKLEWNSCKFLKAHKSLVPDEHGVYCFSIQLGDPFPKDIHLPMYIGKAAPRFLSERFEDYLKEKRDNKGRSKIVTMLNKYENRLFFWWATLPRIYVDTVEEHLLMCCRAPCNESIPDTERLWGKAFG
jgi:hypothetical protein